MPIIARLRKLCSTSHFISSCADIAGVCWHSGRLVSIRSKNGHRSCMTRSALAVPRALVPSIVMYYY